MEQDTKVCKCCGQVKTLDHFKLTRWGTRVSVCTECATQKARDNKIRKQQEEEKLARCDRNLNRLLGRMVYAEGTQRVSQQYGVHR